MLRLSGIAVSVWVASSGVHYAANPDCKPPSVPGKASSIMEVWVHFLLPRTVVHEYSSIVPWGLHGKLCLPVSLLWLCNRLLNTLPFRQVTHSLDVHFLE